MKYFGKQTSSDSQLQTPKIITKKILQTIWSLPIDHEDYKEALFFGLLIGNNSLERYIEMLQTKMDTSEKPHLITKWY